MTLLLLFLMYAVASLLTALYIIAADFGLSASDLLRLCFSLTLLIVYTPVYIATLIIDYIKGRIV